MHDTMESKETTPYQKVYFVKLDHCYSKQVFKYVEDCLYNGVKMFADAETGKTPYTCLYCNRGFFQHKVMHEHVRTEHKVINCSICNIKLSCLKSYKRHIKSKHTENSRPIVIKMFKCAKCGKGFNDRYELDNHEKRHLMFNPFCCLICTKRFKSRAKILRHLYEHGSKSAISCVCVRCSKEFNSIDALDKHMLTHNKELEEDIYTCDDCGESFTQQGDLETHLLTHNDSSSSMYGSLNNGNGFTKSSDFEKQPLTKGQLGLTSHTCKYCEENFDIHMTSIPPLYKCNQCEKDFTKETNLKDNMVTHYEQRSYPFTNNLLVDMSSNVSDFTTRISTPLEYPYICQTCKRSFRFKETLDMHLTVHAKGRPEALEKKLLTFENFPYHCEYCKQKFRFKEVYDEHRMVHMKVDPYINLKKEATFPCKKCGEIFKHKETLDEHILIHVANNERLSSTALQCKQCGEMFNHKETFDEHVLIHVANTNLSASTVSARCLPTGVTSKCEFCEVPCSDIELFSKEHEEHMDNEDEKLPSKEHIEHLDNGDDILPSKVHIKHMDNKDEILPSKEHLEHVDNKDEILPSKERIEHMDSEDEILPSKEHIEHNVMDNKDEQLPLKGNEEGFKHKNNANEKLYQCKICKAKFNNEKRYGIHKLSHWKVKAPIHVDEESKEKDSSNLHEKKYVSRDCFGRRIHYHKRDTRYKCGECGQRFNKIDNLKTHFISHRSQHPSKRFECEVCLKKYASLARLRLHLKIHLGELPYLCRFCREFFDDFISQKAHEESHTRQK